MKIKKNEILARFTAPYWSGMSFTATMKKLPRVGDNGANLSFKRRRSEDVKMLAEKTVTEIKQRTICSHCGNASPNGDMTENVIYVA